MRNFGLALIVAAMAIAGCSQQDADKLGQDAKNLATDAGKSASGLTLAGKVKMALSLRKDVDSSNLKIDAKDGTVTITGHVKSADEKGRVFDVVNNTVGVDKVDNTGLTVDK